MALNEASDISEEAWLFSFLSVFFLSFFKNFFILETGSLIVQDGIKFTI